MTSDMDRKPPAPTGKGLVVLHGELIDRALKDEGIQLGSQRARSSRDLDAAYGKGRAAADKVGLREGLESAGNEVLRLRG